MEQRLAIAVEVTAPFDTRVALHATQERKRLQEEAK
jgi:hypothetical protein